MDEDFIGFLITIGIVCVIGVWFVEYVLPVLLVGGSILCPAGGASYLIGKGIAKSTKNCSLTWKSCMALWAIAVVAGMFLIALFQAAYNWQEILFAFYTIPAGLCCAWIILTVWKKSKNHDLLKEVKLLQRNTFLKNKTVATLQMKIGRIRQELEEKEGKFGSALKDRENWVFALEEIIRSSSEPRMLIMSKDAVFDEACKLNEQKLQQNLVEQEKIPVSNRSDIQSLKIAVYKVVLLDMQSNQSLPNIIQAKEILADLESELSQSLPEQANLVKLLQETKEKLRTRNVVLD